MLKQMLFNMNEPEEIRATIVEDGKVIEFDIETRTREKNRNSIYRGYIVQIEQSIQAAFVEYGANRHGFLPFSEIHPSFYGQQPSSGDDQPPANVGQLLRKGQPVLVQVVREEIGNKGAALTTLCTLPGRYLVYMPMSNNTGISRKIENPTERRTIRDMIKDIKTPNGEGFIVRTASSGMTQESLLRDLEILNRLWTNIQKVARSGPRVGLIFEDGDLLQRMIRDYYDDTVVEILVDEPGAYERAHSYFSAVMPQKPNVVKLYDHPVPLYTAYQIEPQLAQLYQRKISLPSGGSIVIDTTEALVAIDVNSGKTQSDNTEETAYKTNVEACEEIARQLRLRDLGGLIVIDFIGMRMGKHNRGVERAMRVATKDDKARIKIGRISSFFGLLSLSRQRIRDAKGFAFFRECPSCHGMGKVPNTESSALEVFRHLQMLASRGVYERIHASLPQEVAMYLLNHKRQSLAKLEQQFQLTIELHPRHDLSLDFEKDLTLFQRGHEFSTAKIERTSVAPVDQLATAQSVPSQTSGSTLVLPTEPQVTIRTSRTSSEDAGETESRPFSTRSARHRDANRDAVPNRARPSPPAPLRAASLASPAPSQSPAIELTPDKALPVETPKPTKTPKMEKKPGRPWFLTEMKPRQDAQPREEVIVWANQQPNQPHIALPATPTVIIRRREIPVSEKTSTVSAPATQFLRSEKSNGGSLPVEMAPRVEQTPPEKTQAETVLSLPQAVGGSSATFQTADSSTAPENNQQDRLKRLQQELQRPQTMRPLPASPERRPRHEKSRPDANAFRPTGRADRFAPRTEAALSPAMSTDAPPLSSVPDRAVEKTSSSPSQTPDTTTPPQAIQLAPPELPSTAVNTLLQPGTRVSETPISPEAEESATGNSKNNKRPARWTEEELTSLRSLCHLGLQEAHAQFAAQGHERSVASFRQKYYSFRPSS